MGEVWLAQQQQPIARRVAIKLVRPSAGSREVLDRFEAERQALAMMTHPAIARVYDAGVSGHGLPYFAMEYVDGPPLTRHCDDERLDVRQRLLLFREVCDAVQHAHQKAVLHRDLKPSNVLVQRDGGQALPKVIDFGIAKALAGSLAARPLETRLGAFLGTPEYMSPERFSRRDDAADTRADVYALGMILYELLAGALPMGQEVLDSGDPDLIRRSVTSATLPRPSARLAVLPDAAAIASRRRTDLASLVKALRRDLDWIVMKAIEPDAARRYASAAELSQDLQSYLEGRPVRARPPSAAYLAGRFVQRHRAAVAAATAAAMLLVLGAVGTGIGFLQAREAEAVARREAAAAEQSLQFLVHLFEQSNPLAAGGPKLTLRELLDVGARQLDRELGGDPLVNARLKQAIGRSYWTVSANEAAGRLLNEALEQQYALLGPTHLQTLQTERYLAELYWASGPLDEAERLARRAVAAGEASLGRDHREVLDATSVLVNVLSRRGQLQEARTVALDLLERRRRISGPRATETAQALYDLAGIEAQLGDRSGSLQRHREALDIRHEVHGPDHLLTLQSEMAVARFVRTPEELADAEATMRRVQRELYRVWGTDGKPAYRTSQQLGEIHFRQGRWDDARIQFEAALAGYRRLLAPDHPDILSVASRLGQVCVELGDVRCAEPLLEEACTGRAAQFGDDAPGTRESCGALRSLDGNDPSTGVLDSRAFVVRPRESS